MTDEKPIILVIDDNLSNIKMVVDYLKKSGYETAVARNGPMGITRAELLKPALILLDILMPEMDGFEVCRRLKNNPKTASTPVIFMTALDSVDDRVNAFAAGGDDYIPKPAQREEVLVRVEHHLMVSRLHDHLTERNTRLQQREAELQHHNRELSALNRLGRMVSDSLELSRVLETALEEIERLMQIVSASFWLRDHDTDELVCMHAMGPGHEHLIQQRLDQGQGLTGWVIEHDESAVVADLKTDPRHFGYIDELTGMAVHSMLSIPLRRKDDIIGVFNLADSRVSRFTEQDLQFAELVAAKVSIAIDNARLYTLAQQEITERRQAEDALQAANQKLQYANDTKDTFFSIISHDLRSPFTVLLGQTEIMDTNFNSFEREYLHTRIHELRKMSQHLYALLENLLLWSRLQRGRIEFVPQDVDLSFIVNELLTVFQPKAAQKHIRLKHDLQQDFWVYADVNMLRTVLRNLVSNALKFTEEGGQVDISAQFCGPSLEIAVTDTGLGINAEALEKIFRIDAHHSTRGTHNEKGSGLGLILCHDLVMRHGGTIDVESTPGKGATFRCTFLVKKEDDE